MRTYFTRLKLFLLVLCTLLKYLRANSFVRHVCIVVLLMLVSFYLVVGHKRSRSPGSTDDVRGHKAKRSKDVKKHRVIDPV